MPGPPNPPRALVPSEMQPAQGDVHPRALLMPPSAASSLNNIVCLAVGGALTLNGGAQTLPLASAEYDPLGMLKGNTIVVPRPGVYLAIVSFNTNPAGALSTQFTVNGAVQRFTNYNITGVILQGVAFLRCKAGDAISGQVVGPNLQAVTLGSDRTYLHVSFLSQ